MASNRKSDYVNGSKIGEPRAVGSRLDRTLKPATRPSSKSAPNVRGAQRDPVQRHDEDSLWLARNDEKRCKRCRFTIPVSEFSKATGIYADNLSKFCKMCERDVRQINAGKLPEGHISRKARTDVFVPWSVPKKAAPEMPKPASDTTSPERGEFFGKTLYDPNAVVTEAPAQVSESYCALDDDHPEVQADYASVEREIAARTGVSLEDAYSETRTITGRLSAMQPEMQELPSSLFRRPRKLIQMGTRMVNPDNILGLEFAKPGEILVITTGMEMKNGYAESIAWYISLEEAEELLKWAGFEPASAIPSKGMKEAYDRLMKEYEQLRTDLERVQALNTSQDVTLMERGFLLKSATSLFQNLLRAHELQWNRECGCPQCQDIKAYLTLATGGAKADENNSERG